MTRSRSALVALAAMLAAPPLAQAQPPPSAPLYDERELDRHLVLAESFYRREQFYRAIGVLEELRLFAPTPALQSWAGLRIAMAYHRGAQYPDAIAAYDAALTDPALAADVRNLVAVQRSLARAEHGVTDPGRVVLGDVIAELAPIATEPSPAGFHAAVLRARVATLTGDRELVRTSLAAARTGCGALSACARVDVLERAAGAPRPRRRSPLLGMTFSILAPGLGSVYAAHHVDGIYYGGLTGLTAIGAYSAYDRDRGLGDQRAAFWGLATAAGVFYLANVMHGYIASRRFNMIERQRWQVRVWDGSAQPLPLADLPAPR